MSAWSLAKKVILFIYVFINGNQHFQFLLTMCLASPCMVIAGQCFTFSFFIYLFFFNSCIIDPLIIINLNLWDQKKNTIFVYCWHLSIRSFRKEKLDQLYFVLDSEFQTLVLMNDFHDSYTSGHYHWSIFGFIFLHLCLYLLPINSLILW